jgi:tRNA/rRNA methyltransferase|tara:strand:+ start:2317 stop:3060 length:744 start_codon:yes stop_codon:yes gene_type:complete
VSVENKHPCFIFVNPQMGENIGASARGMWNFGLERMRIVAPRDGWPNQKAVAMASGAGRLLDEALIFPTFTDAIADQHFIFATTARPRDLLKPIYSPEEAMKLAFSKISRGQNVGFAFGPERSGLENSDIVKANAIVSVPVNAKFPSLNLAQCALLLAYEWMLKSSNLNNDKQILEQSSMVDVMKVEKLSQYFEDALEKADFFYPEDKAESMKINFRNMWSRMPLTNSDVQIFYGMLRQLLRANKKS